MATPLLRQLEPLLRLAALAPSSHNSQPWRVQALPDIPALARGAFAPSISQALELSLDPQRRLNALPVLEREMLLSLGGFAAILFNALTLAGWAPQVHLLNAQRRQPKLLIGLAAAPHADGLQHERLAQLDEALKRRQTERGLYRPDQALAFDTVHGLLPHSMKLSAHPGRWTTLADPAALATVGAFYAQHAARDLLHPSAWRETYRHLRFGSRPQLPQGEGIDIERLLGPMSALGRFSHRLLLHPRWVGLLGPLGLFQRVGDALQQRIQSSAGVVFLSLPSHRCQTAELLQAGEQIVSLWLSAAHRQQALHPLSVALQHEDLHRQLRTLLGCTDDILFIGRAGTPCQVDVAPRRRRLPELFCTRPTT